MNEIFILGTSRTGSKFYMQLLNTHKDIFVCPELMFMHPLKKDFYSIVERFIKDGSSEEMLADELLRFKERRPYEKIINEIGRKGLIEGLKKLGSVTPYSVFCLIIQLSAKLKNKSIYGAKSPVHFSYSENMLREFQTSKVIYLMRDPRAIFVSDYKKKRKESKGEFYRFPVKGILLRPVVLFYVIREWRNSLKVYEDCKKKYSNNRIILMRYENVLSDSKSVVQNISDLLKTSPMEFDIDKVKVVDSSYSQGVSADRWKKEIFLHEKLLFKLLLGRMMRQYGYN